MVGILNNHTYSVVHNYTDTRDMTKNVELTQRN